MSKFSSIVKEFFLWDYCYNLINVKKVKSWVKSDEKANERIRDSLSTKNITVLPYVIDILDFKKFLQSAIPLYTQFNYYGGGTSVNFNEKALEHYLAATFLNLTKDDIYIDIANANSPTPEIYQTIYGCEVYRQDLIFTDGIHGNIIGGDAGNMPLENQFASKMALHCSFEHFENDSDIRFIIETARVLKSGGKLCIVPLYMHNEYAIQTDPAIIPFKELRALSFENDATIYCAKGYSNRHGRFYDVNHFIDRIQKSCRDLKLTVYYIENEKQIDSTCYVKFIALFEKK